VFAKLSDYRDGLIEIAHPANGKSFAPTCAKHFPLTRGGCKDASAYAARQNDKGCNVYYGQCVVSPDAALNKRTTDAGFCAVHTVVLDADTTGQVEATISALQGLVAPVACILTGTTPEPRVQCCVRLVEPCTDVQEFKKALASLTAFTGGDAGAKGAMLRRLPGMISHPSPDKAEKGYVRELVQLEPFDFTGKDGTPPRDSLDIDAMIALAPEAAMFADKPCADKPRANGKASTSADEIEFDADGKIKDGHSAAWRNIVLEAWRVFQEEHGTDPTAQELYDLADIKFQKLATHKERWNGTDLKTRHRHIVSTHKRILNGDFVARRIASIDNAEHWEQAQEHQKERDEEYRQERNAADPCESWEMDHDPDIKHPEQGHRPELARSFLDGDLHTLVHGMAEANATSPDFIFASMLAVCGSVLAGKTRVVFGAWEQAPVIWAALVGTSGTAKSPAIKAICAPLYAEDSSARAAHDTEMKAYREAKEAYTAARKVWELEVKKAVKDGNDTPPIHPACTRIPTPNPPCVARCNHAETSGDKIAAALLPDYEPR
jgi:hypothetical protein